MKEFVPLDHRGCFSSSSTLSPLAPPFKLDTSLPRPVSHPYGNIAEPQLLEPYFDSDPSYVFASRPPHDNWLQMNSPNLVPSMFSTSNPSLSLSLGTNPALPVCTAPSSASKSVTNFFGSESLGRPYHPQHSSASVQFGSAPFAADEHDDKFLESSFSPAVPSGGLWSPNNGVELWELHFPPNHAGEVNQGKPYAGSPHTNLSGGKLSSESDEKSGGVQFTTSRTSTLNPVSHKKRPYHCAASSNLSTETWNQFNPSVASYGSHSTGFGPFISDPSCFYPASSNLYEPPSIIGDYTGLVSKTTHSSINPIEPPKNACKRKESCESQSSSSTSCIPVNADKSDDRSVMSGLIDPFMDPLMKINIKLPQQTPRSSNPVDNVQVTDTLVTPETRDAAAFHCSSEELEQFNHVVDSPCWKGASDSRYSLFGTTEGGGNSFNIQGTQRIPVNSNSAVDFSSSAKQSSVVSASRDSCPSILEGGSNNSQLNNENAIQCSIPGNTDGGSDFKSFQAKKATFQKGNTDMKQHSSEGGIVDSGIGSKDAANFEATQLPYHVSERYASLLSRDNAPIDHSSTESIAESSDVDTLGCKFTGGSVRTMVNLMQNLSGSLLSCCSEDEDELMEYDYAVIQQVVQNLSMVLKMSSTPRTHSPQAETTNCSGKPVNAQRGTMAARSEATHTTVQDAHGQYYTQNCIDEQNNSPINMEEVDSPRSSLPCNDFGEKDDSTKRIRMILEENFHEEESDMQLYKSLWLDAEAELCSQKYKERFARMKIEVEKNRKNITNDKPPSAEVRLEGNRDPMEELRNEVSVGTEVPKVPIQEENKLNSSRTDDASVMARFHILKSREERQPDDAMNDDSHLGTEKIPSSPPSGNAEDIVMKQQQQQQQETVVKYPCTFFRDLEAKDPSKHQDVMDFGAMQSAITNVLMERRSAGGSESPPSGWEHVLKEAAWAWSAY